MPCEEWCKLLELYRNAVSAYNVAVNKVNPLPGAAFTDSWQRAEHLRKQANNGRADLLHHEHDHGCLADGHLLGSKQVPAANIEDFILGDQGQSGE